MDGHIFDTHLLSPYLGGLGILGTLSLLATTGIVLWQYRGCRFQSYSWRLRSWRFKQLSAIACLFFLAMAASYWVIEEPWGWLYLIAGFKTGTWWIRRAMSRG